MKINVTYIPSEYWGRSAVIGATTLILCWYKEETV